LGVIILVFLIMRVLVLWYWKIDKIVDLLNKIEENTRSDKNKKEETKNN